MIDMTAAGAFEALSMADREQMTDWVDELDLLHAMAFHGLITVRLAELGVRSISGTVELP